MDIFKNILIKIKMIYFIQFSKYEKSSPRNSGSGEIKTRNQQNQRYRFRRHHAQIPKAIQTAMSDAGVTENA